MNVSRRDFLKGSLAGAAALALTGVGIGKGTPEAEAAGLNSKDPAEKPSFFTNPYNHAASDAVQTVTAEVVVVGAGNAGCADAASLADNNVQTVVIEQQNVIHGQGGGIVKCEAPLYACKVMAVCPKCGKPTRQGFKIGEDGKKVRVCKNAGCGAEY